MLDASRLTNMAKTHKIGEFVNPIAVHTLRSIHLVANIDVLKRSEKPEKYLFNITVVQLETWSISSACDSNG